MLCQETFTKTLLQAENPHIVRGDALKSTTLPFAVVMVFLLATFGAVGAYAEIPPQPPNVGTLGPVVLSTVNSGNVAILAPENGAECANPVQLRLKVEVDGVFGQFGNVGFSVDGGVVKSVTKFESKSSRQIKPYWYTTRTLAVAFVTLPTLDEGEHNATVYYGWQHLGVQDNPDLKRFEVYSYANVTFVIKNPDTTAPSISVEPPLDNIASEDSVELKFFTNETAVWMGYSFDGQDNVTVTGNTTLSELQNGVHNVTVYATDAANNTGASETLTFTVDVPEPFPIMLVAVASVAAVAAVSVGVLAYVKRSKKKTVEEAE